ncbi:MAG: exodeoxyribonuclease VII small subunit [Proteobacteria bacterium]|nr:exodeoxyribonuclease VII small subunit [Pseudomonadota bacterium]MBU4287075.1 exodeoxyribonuclease VII small subunit [Pseudomonadota bacterium]MBU4414380.1 exodeoxyribonuclease VII small subunit [Pseudomonadota bacterium]
MMAKMTFEKSLKQLEQIVQELESGNLPLENAMKKFEEGVKLSKYCSEKLDETEKKISVLLRDNKGDITEEPFMPENESKDD